MSAQNFLTLAITEVDPRQGNFFVVVMEERSLNICQLELTKDQIISDTGKVFWDIGFTTRVDGELKDKYNNDIQNPKLLEGSATLAENKIGSLKKLLEAKSSSPDDFFNNPNKVFGVVKVDEVISIYKKDYPDRTSHYMEFLVAGGSLRWKDVILLNKDYRWKKYWEWVGEFGDYQAKSNEYEMLFRKSSKSLYLVVHKHRYRDGNVFKWIVGMHWL